MTRARAAWVLGLLALAACGSRTPGGASPAAATADAGTAEPEVEPEDVPADGGAGDGGAAFLVDASLGEIGVAPCEAVVARILACPNAPEGSKRQMVEASRRWREEAASSADARQRVAALCLEIARMSEEMLVRSGC